MKYEIRVQKSSTKTRGFLLLIVEKKKLFCLSCALRVAILQSNFMISNTLQKFQRLNIE